MRQMDVSTLYELGSRLRGLFDVRAHTRIGDFFGPLTEAQRLLDRLIKGDPYTLRSAKPSAVKLLNAVATLFDRYFIDPETRQLAPPTDDATLAPQDLTNLALCVEKFDHAFVAELATLPHYLAEQRGIYATRDLAENAHHVFAETLRAHIPPPTQKEIQHAGEALVFGLGTSAGFHALRGLEIMLKAYYESFVPTPAPKNERSYGLYLKKLVALSDDNTETRHPDKRIVQMLAQIKDHYRNPMITPEHCFSIEESTALFSLSTALIALMAEKLTAN